MIVELLTLFTSLLVGYVAYTIWKNRSLPPGPFPLPVIGNLLSIGKKPHIDLANMANKYGHIFRIQMGRRKVLVINSYDIAREALVKKAADFAGRPNHFIGSIFGRNSTGIVFQTFTSKWKAQHKIASAALCQCEGKVGSEKRNILLQIDELSELFLSHNEKPFQIRDDMFRSVGNCFSFLIFGKTFEGVNTELDKLIDAIHVFAASLGAANIIDAFPVFKYIPLEVIKRAKRAGKDRDVIFEREFQEHLTTFHKDNIRDVMDAMLKEYEDIDANSNLKDLLEKDHLISSASDLFIAGTETTASVIIWIILYLTKYPDVQARLHTQLDDVIGPHDRLPQLADKPDLPYVAAITAEVQRIVSALPMAVPHSATRDTFLAGFFVPQEMTVFLNLWAIHHDPNRWRDPFCFRPDRFLDESGQLKADGIMPYSAGRRSCTGESFAKKAVFLYTAHLFYRFQFECPSGEALPDVQDSDYGIVLDCKPFKVCASIDNAHHFANTVTLQQYYTVLHWHLKGQELEH